MIETDKDDGLFDICIQSLPVGNWDIEVKINVLVGERSKVGRYVLFEITGNRYFVISTPGRGPLSWIEKKIKEAKVEALEKYKVLIDAFYRNEPIYVEEDNRPWVIRHIRRISPEEAENAKKGLCSYELEGIKTPIFPKDNPVEEFDGYRISSASRKGQKQIDRNINEAIEEEAREGIKEFFDTTEEVYVKIVEVRNDLLDVGITPKTVFMSPQMYANFLSHPRFYNIPVFGNKLCDMEIVLIRKLKPNEIYVGV